MTTGQTLLSWSPSPETRGLQSKQAKIQIAVLRPWKDGVHTPLLAQI